MAITQLSEVIVPDQFTGYTVENSLSSNALSQSGVVIRNAMIANQF
jgi:hypothetical protein